MITRILISILALGIFNSCSSLKQKSYTPLQFIYEGDGLVIYKICSNTSAPKRGRYAYYAKDQNGDVKIWSNTKFEIGDTIKFSVEQSGNVLTKN